MKQYTVNGQEEIQAASANDAIRTFASDQGYRTINEPDIHGDSGEWTDEDGTTYTVELQ